MMAHASNLAPGGQQLLHMTLPPGRIVAAAVFARLGPIQNSGDPAAHAPRRLCLIRPNRLYHPQHGVRVDRGNRHAAEHRIGVGLERRRPLLALRAVFPAGFVGLDIRGGAVLEGDAARRRMAGLHPFGFARLYWIDASK